MSRNFAILRATFRLKGTLLFWIFASLLLAVSLLINLSSTSPKTAFVSIVGLTFAAWLGWFLFLPRLWQLQSHAEELQLPDARRAHEQSTLLLCLLGTAGPAILLSATGADFGNAMLGMVLALATAGLYLMFNAVIGLILIVLSIVLPHLIKHSPELMLLLGEYKIALLWLLALAGLGIAASRWRGTMRASPDIGWRAPQVVQLAQRGDLSLNDERNDPARHWLANHSSPLSGAIGPRTPIRSLAVLVCGSMAPMGWRSFLRSSVWMTAAVLFLALLSLSEDNSQSGPQFGLLILLSIWALAIPMTLITRLRQEWSGSGQGLAEAFLLPGLVNPRLSWLQVMAATLYTALYRLALPAVLVFVALAISTGSLLAGSVTLLIASWALLLSLTLLPLAQRQGGWATFVLYVLMGMIVVTVIATHLIIHHSGPSIPWILPIATGIVLISAAVGGLFPRSQSPFALSAS